MIIRKIPFLLISLIALNILTAQNGFRSGDGWGIGWSTTDYWSGTGFGSTFGKTYQNTSGAGNRYFRLYTDWGGNTREHGPSGTSDVQISINTATNLETWGSSGKAYFINVAGSSGAYNYIFRTKYGDGISNTPQLIVFQIQGAIRTVTGVTQNPIANNVGISDPVTITASLDGNLNGGQNVYLRYTTDNWSTSSIINMTGSGTTYQATIPGEQASATVKYYVFTSGNGLTITPQNADWFSINGNTNNGNNYSYTVNSGNVTVNPSFPDDNQSVTLTLNATGTALAGATKIYFHAGVAIDQDHLTDFNYTVGNWGQDDGIGEMTNVAGNTWQIVLTTGIRQYFSVPEDKDIFGLNFLFRNATGNLKLDNNGQNYFNAVDPGNFFTITNPDEPIYFAQTGSTLNVTASANTPPTTWTLNEIDTLTNSYITTISTQNGLAAFSSNINIQQIYLKKYKLIVDFNGTTKYKTFSVRGYNPIVEEARPSWTKPGINYHTSDPTKVTLVLHAPTYTQYKKGTGIVSGTNTTTAKNVVYVIGDFNNWFPSESYKLKRDRDGWNGTTDSDNDNDHGDYWWIELSGLTPGQEYIFQYLIDGNLQVADPYSNKISDPDDQYISNIIYPNLIAYPSGASDRASVMQTNQLEYNWTSPVFQKPSMNKLNVYELHFRDFTEEGTYIAAIDKLDYIKGLGINAIHVMPVSEFEGNNSWGYNPNFYFAPDKAYGTKNDLKKFIDECHKRKILVFNDLVLNHAFYSNVMAKMYWNSTLNKPANDNPWFNPDHKMIYDSNGHWGADWNHESEHTQAMVDRILDYWIQEFKFDGFRFDFTKGFGQTAPDPSDPWAGSYDQDRIDLLMRMANGMKNRNPGSIAIFEHLADYAEEKNIADQGILMWSGVGHHDSVKRFILGWNNDDTNIYSSGVYNSPSKNFIYANLMSYAESHDEQRLGYEVKSYFNWNSFTGPKSSSSDSLNAIIDRLKMGLGFNLLLPGPRMLWELQELGYDISIDFNGRTGEKPVKWNYLQSDKRKELYSLGSKIFKLRNNFDIYSTTPDYGNIGLGSGNITIPRVMRFSSNSGKHAIIVANIDPAASHNVTPQFDITGTWYKYNGNQNIDGTEFTVNNVSETYTLQVSECLIFTNFKIDKCTEVLKNTDSGADNTLRKAIECAVAGDTVIIDYSVYNNTINLNSPILIDKNIYIKGFSDKNITINGLNLNSSVFNIAENANVKIMGINMTCPDIAIPGRCIFNQGNLTLDNVAINDTGNPATGNGIYNTGNGTITIENSLIIDN